MKIWFIVQAQQLLRRGTWREIQTPDSLLRKQNMDFLFDNSIVVAKNDFIKKLKYLWFLASFLFTKICCYIDTKYGYFIF